MNPERLWNDPSLFASTAVAMATDRLGLPNLSHWDQETIVQEIKAEFSLPELVDSSVDRLMAGLTLLRTDLFHTRLSAFVPLCNSLSWSPFHPDQADLADAYECTWGITEAQLLAPLEDDEEYSDEIKTYIRRILEAEGLSAPPRILKMFDEEPLRQVAVDYSDDPDMFGSIRQFADEKKEELETVIKHRLQILMNQLQSLELQHGNTQDLIERLRHPS